MDFDTVAFTDLLIHIICIFASLNIFLAMLSRKRAHFPLRYGIIILLLICLTVAFYIFTLSLTGTDIDASLKTFLLRTPYVLSTPIALACLIFCYKARWVHYLLTLAGGELIKNLVILLSMPIKSIIAPNSRAYFVINLLVFALVGGAVFTVESLLCKRKFSHLSASTIEDCPKNRFFFLFLELGVFVINETLLFALPLSHEWMKVPMYISWAIINVGILLYVLEKLNVRDANIEKQVLKRLLSEKERQYAISKENIEIINCKCHDLKRQIEALRISPDENRQSLIDELSKEVRIYDSIIKTTNETLNVILTEKAMICEAKHINFSCIADGDALSGIGDVDLYLLFSNALDNAIEASVKIENEDDRAIGIMVERLGNFVSIRISNNYVGEVNIRPDGRIPTYKSDTAHHGYGISSMEYSAKKYGGIICMGTDGGVFILQIILPINN